MSHARQSGEQMTLELSGNEQGDCLSVHAVNVDVHCTQGSYVDLEEVKTLENQDAIQDFPLEGKEEEEEEDVEEEEETGNSGPIMECEERNLEGDIQSDCDEDVEEQWEIVGKHKKRKVIKKYNMRKSSRNKIKLKVISSKRKSDLVSKEGVNNCKDKNTLSHDKVCENSSNIQ